MFDLFKRLTNSPTDLLASKLFDEKTFYKAFMYDLSQCTNEVVIESPFITGNRMASLIPALQKLTSRAVSVTINTRHPIEHDSPFDAQAMDAIERLQNMGVQVLFTGNHHRKLAIFDRRVLWEGSLNILSQNDSCEIMRRIESEAMAQEMIRFVKIDKFLS